VDDAEGVHGTASLALYPFEFVRPTCWTKMAWHEVQGAAVAAFANEQPTFTRSIPIGARVTIWHRAGEWAVHFV